MTLTPCIPRRWPPRGHRHLAGGAAGVGPGPRHTLRPGRQLQVTTGLVSLHSYKHYCAFQEAGGEVASCVILHGVDIRTLKYKNFDVDYTLENINYFYLATLAYLDAGKYIFMKHPTNSSHLVDFGKLRERSGKGRTAQLCSSTCLFVKRTILSTTPRTKKTLYFSASCSIDDIDMMFNRNV